MANEQATSHSSPAATTVASVSTASSSEREALELKKLWLENEETASRIKQLQLHWWQKPVPTLTALAGAIPILFTVVVQLSNTWSAEKQKVAKEREERAIFIQDKAELELEKVDIEKKKTQVDINQLTFDRKVLESDKQVLEKRVEDLEAAERKIIDQVFGRFTRICEIGGDIVTAVDADAARLHLNELDGFDLFAIGASGGTIRQSIDKQLGLWKAGDPPSQDLRLAVLSLSSACKQAFDKYRTDQFKKPVRALTLGIYHRADEMVAALREAQNPKDAKTAKAINDFWHLYYGELVLVESHAISNAMVDASRFLERWKEGAADPKAFESLVSALKTEINTMSSAQASIAEP